MPDEATETVETEESAEESEGVAVVAFGASGPFVIEELEVRKPGKTLRAPPK
jgi:hypothetical protein